MKIKYFIRSFLLILIGFVIDSCGPTTYMRNTVNVPAFEKKEEKQVSGIVRPGSIELQGAYSLDSNWGFILNGSMGLRDPVGGYLADHKMWSSWSIEGGTGYITGIGKKNSLEFFLGYGHGWSRGDFKRQYGWSSFNTEFLNFQTEYNQYFLQANYIHHISNWQIGIAGKGNFVHYPRYHYEMRRDEYCCGSKIDTLIKASIHEKDLTGFILDPVLFAHWERGRFQFLGRLGYSFSFFDPEQEFQGKSGFTGWLKDHPRYPRVILRVGVRLRFGKGNF